MIKTCLFFQRFIILCLISFTCKTALYAQDFPKFQYKIGATATYDFSTSSYADFNMANFGNFDPDLSYSIYTYSIGSYALTQQFYLKKWFIDIELGVSLLQNKSFYQIDMEGVPRSIYVKTNNAFLMGALTFNRYFKIGEKAGLSIGAGIKLSYFASDSFKNNKFSISSEFRNFDGAHSEDKNELENFEINYYRYRYTNTLSSFFTPIVDFVYLNEFNKKHTIFFKGSVALWNIFRFKDHLYYFYDDNSTYFTNGVSGRLDSGAKGPIFSLSVGYTFGISK